jgi:hypothetical protein
MNLRESVRIDLHGPHLPITKRRKKRRKERKRRKRKEPDLPPQMTAAQV